MAKASKAQARQLFRMWLLGKPVPLIQTSTSAALIRYGWVTATDEIFTFPNEATVPRYRVNLDGLRAARDTISQYIDKGEMP